MFTIGTPIILLIKFKGTESLNFIIRPNIQINERDFICHHYVLFHVLVCFSSTAHQHPVEYRYFLAVWVPYPFSQTDLRQ